MSGIHADDMLVLAYVWRVDSQAAHLCRLVSGRFEVFPEDVKDDVGYALWLAQKGQKHEDAKPLKGFGGAGVLEILESYRGDAYRAVYTVRFPEAVYVLHAFKKSQRKA